MQAPIYYRVAEVTLLIRGSPWRLLLSKVKKSSSLPPMIARGVWTTMPFPGGRKLWDGCKMDKAKIPNLADLEDTRSKEWDKSVEPLLSS